MLIFTQKFGRGDRRSGTLSIYVQYFVVATLHQRRNNDIKPHKPNMGRRKKYVYKPFPSPRSTEAKQAVCILEIQVI